MIERYCDISGEPAVRDLGAITHTTYEPKVWETQELEGVTLGLSLRITCFNHPDDRTGPPDLSKSVLLELLGKLKEHIEQFQ